MLWLPFWAAAAEGSGKGAADHLCAPAAQVTAAAPYPGGFPELGPPLVHSQGVDYRFKEAYSAAKMILEGVRCLRLVWQWLAVRWVDGKTTVK